MDPRERADAALARARARSAFVVTPECAVSPMDAASTVQIPRAVVNALDPDQQSADTTMVLPAARSRTTTPSPSGQPAAHVPPGPAPARPTIPPWPPQNEQPGPPPRQWDGLAPTVQQPGTQRGTLSRRLDGTD